METQQQPTPGSSAEPSKSASTSSGSGSSSKPGSNTGIVIVIIVLAVIILGVGGYFAYKYLLKKNTNKTTSTTTSSGKVSVKTIAEALMYPGATITDQKQDSNSANKADLTLSTPDSVAVIKAHYLKLVTDKGWKITRQGSSGDDNYYLTVTDNIFEAEIDITKYTGYDTTDIGITISGESLISDGLLISPTTAKSSSTSTAAKTSATSTSSSDYIISDSNTRVISKSELTSLTPWLLKVARNEIYARYGREFVHKDLQCYFAKKSWYKANANFSESSLSSTENKNVATIQAYESETSSPLASKDSGCNTNQ